MKKLVALVTLMLALTLISAVTAETVAATDTFVLTVGEVTSYGPKPAFGFLKAFAKIDAWARVNIAWMTAPLPIVPLPGSPVSPVIFAFYIARLVNASMVKLDFTDAMGKTHDFYVDGLWNVLNVTFVYKDSTFYWVAEPMKSRAPGILTVDPDPDSGAPWAVFTLAIQDLLPVNGLIIFHRIKTVEIPEGDINLDGKIDIRDIATVAKSYGTMPGRAGFDFRMDINFDFRIDIKDIATVAKAFGTRY